MEFKNGYALLIAVDDNEVKRWALPEVAKDITALNQVLKHPEHCAYPVDNVNVISGKRATRQGILNGLKWLRDRIKEDQSNNTTGLIYYTGHGWRDDLVDPSAFYLIPYDMREGKIRSRALKTEDFAAEVEAVKPRRLVVILDCCHAAGMGVKDLSDTLKEFESFAMPTELFIKEKAVSASDGKKGLEELGQGSGRAVLSSSSGEQYSYIRKDGKMSIFTYHLIEALTGHAQPQEGATQVLISDVMGHVWRKVPDSVKNDWGEEQDPDYQVSGNFPIALLLGGKEWRKDLGAPNPLNIFTPSGLIAKCSVTIILLNSFIEDPSRSNDRKAWRGFTEFIKLVEQSSSEYEIEDVYDELKEIKKNIARLRTERKNYKNAGHFQDASKTQSVIQSNYDNSIAVIKEIQEKLT